MNRIPQLILKITAIIICLFIASTGFTQHANEKKERPKIGLVLSGGGAKGLAHIGVIKVLEEAGIKPDIITGTSMGSIVGSLYAVGYTVEELTEINENADWETLLTDDENLQRVTMLEKRESKKYLFEIPIKEKKMNLPAGLIEGQHLENCFTELFWPLTSHENFDSLPIPFHCMSVDLISGKAIEHKSGDLAKSVRASMSIPTVFSPVHMDSMLLVDGGVTRNFPVQEAIDMGADIIIGVYLGYQEDVKAGDNFTLTDILQRSMVLPGIVDAREQKPKCDLLIVPDLGKFGPGDFTKGKAIQQLGEDAARRQMDEIQALAAQLNLKSKTIPKIKRPKRILIRDIEVEGLQLLSKNDIVSRSGIEKGDSVSLNNIREAIDYMFGTRHFNKLTYSLKKNKHENGYILVFHAQESPRAMFKFAPNYNNELGLGMVMNFTMRNVVLPSSRFLFSVNIAENPGVSLVFDRKIGESQHWSDEIFFNLNKYKLPYYDEGERLGNYNRGYLDFGYGINYSLGLNHHLGAKGFFRNSRHAPQPDLYNIYPEAEFNAHTTNDWGFTVFYCVNTTDHLFFPKKGTNLKMEFTQTAIANSQLNTYGFEVHPNYFLDEMHNSYSTFCFNYNWYKTFAKRFTYNFGVDAGFNTDNAGVNGMFVLGGEQLQNTMQYKNLAGFSFAELYTYNYAFIKSALNIEVATGLYLSGTVNIGNTGNTMEEMFDNFSNYPINRYSLGYSFGIKYDSVLGPAQLLIADNNMHHKTEFLLSVGFPF